MGFTTFVWLMIFAHFIGDYVLQTQFLATTKGKYWYNMLVHCILYTGSVGLVLMKWIDGFPYYGIPLLLVSHWVIDSWKCRGLKRESTDDYTENAYLYADQAYHFISLMGLIIWYR